MNKITIEAIIKAPMEKVWAFYNQPEHITKWAFASNDWEAPSAENDLRERGKFKTRMQAKNGSAGFDFEGIYAVVKDPSTSSGQGLIEYDMSDGRHVKTEFVQVPEGVKVTVTFDPENQNSEEVQRKGWQAILDNFKKHTESN